MTQTEGVIRYRLDYRPGPLPADPGLEPLFRWFARCRERHLIGRSPGLYDGFAYGNISIRSRRGFIISGTQTGGEARLTPDDLALVEDLSAEENWIRATGPAKPSSEAMTHGQIYQQLAAVGAIIHAHSAVIWQRAQALGMPLTPARAAYGTPEMAAEVAALLRSSTESTGIFAMGGHQDGIVSYGPDMESAGNRMLDTLAGAESLAAT